MATEINLLNCLNLAREDMPQFTHHLFRLYLTNTEHSIMGLVVSVTEKITFEIWEGNL